MSYCVVNLLATQLFYSAIVFLIVLTIISAFKRIPQRWQMGLWLLVVIRLVLPPDLSFTFSGRNLMSRIPAIQKSVRFLSDLFQSKTDTGFSIASGDHFISDATLKTSVSTSSFRINGNARSAFYNIIFTSWLAGILASMFYYRKKIRYYNKILTGAQVVADNTLANMVILIKRNYGIRRKIEIRTSDHFLSPFTKGILKPKVFVPTRIIETDDNDMLISVLAHELAHIKRFDDLWIKMLNVVQILYFFNPVLWYVNSRIRLSRECLCDQLALSHQKISAQRYGSGILTVLKLNLIGTEKLEFLPSFGNHKKQFIIRLKNLNGGYTVKKYQTIFSFVLLFLFGLMLLPMSGDSFLSHKNSASDVYAVENATTSQFECPLKQGRVSAKFGKIMHPYTKKEYNHIGIDIAAPNGTEVYAADAGTVIEVKLEYLKNKGTGKFILIEHENGFKTRYTHLGEILVKENDVIQKGALIAKVGSTGLSTGPHLHFEIRLNDTPVNPEKYIDLSDLEKH